MKNRFFFVCGFILIINLSGQNSAYAEKALLGDNPDIVMIASRQSKLDVRKKYTFEIMEKALSLSADKYGAYEVKLMPFSMSNETTFYELAKGKLINVTMSGATPDKDHLGIPIRIPLRRGILNYRLLVINKNNLELFKDVTNVEQLKPHSVGIHEGAVTSEILKVLGFSVTEAATYDGMFRQLSQNSFDYIPRGIHEIYDEIEIRKNSNADLIIEPNLALYIPMPYYIYVSPSFPRLAERFKYGLEKMIEQELIKTIFDKYYGKYLKRANLAERTIIDIGNPFLPSETPLHRKELWMDGFSIKPNNTNNTNN